jgi:hypothetical protein
MVVAVGLMVLDGNYGVAGRRSSDGCVAEVFDDNIHVLDTTVGSGDNFIMCALKKIYKRAKGVGL